MRLNYGKTFLLGFGFFGVSVIWGVYNAFVPVFLSERFNLAPAVIGFFMTLDNFAALLIQPAVGNWSDKLRTRIGRRMPFILVGAPLGALAFGWIPLASVLPLFVAGTTTLLLSMALWRTPVVALMPDITPSPLRSQANGIINFIGGVGGIIAFLVGANLYDMNPAYPFWLGSALVIASAVLVFAFIREPQVTEPPGAQPNLLASLREVLRDRDRSALRILLAIFCWFVGYTAIEAFFNLYAVNHLGISESNGTRLLGGLSLIFVLFALPSGYLGGRFGRRPVIMLGLLILGGVITTLYVLPPATLLGALAPLPMIGISLTDGGPASLTLIGLLLMVAALGWACININSLPMVVDMTSPARIGTFTGLYYLFSTLAAIAGPNVYGWIVQLTGENYNTGMLVAPLFMVAAIVLMLGVKRGEAVAVAPASA
jgi:Na+/melibiose symporter-like transporter